MDTELPKSWLSKHWLFLTILVAFFVLPFFIPPEYIENLKIVIAEQHPAIALATISFFLILATIVAPLNTLTLVPFASAIFGWEIIFVILVISWTVGATMAFLIARRFGLPALRALGIVDEAASLSDKIPREHMFSGLVLLRIFMPVDVLSYAVGLLIPMPLWQYVLATAIGVTPFSFIWSYAGEAAISKDYPALMTIAALALVVFVFSIYFFRRGKYGKK